MQDRIPDGYTILRLGSKSPDTSGLEKAVASYGAPVSTLDIPDQVAREVYGFDVILLRPDMHIVWRGNAMPEDPASVTATATGH